MTSNLKFPFLAALLFHAAALAGLGAWKPAIKSSVMEVTPIAILDLPKEEAPPAVKAEEKKEAPVKKMAKPIEAQRPEPVREVKPVKAEEPEPVREIKEEPIAEPVTEAPAPEAEAEASAPQAAEEPSAPAVTAQETGAVASSRTHSDEAQGVDEMVYFKSIAWQRIERSKVYPRWARERGFEGVVGVRFVIEPDGGVSEVKVVRPCHCDILNKAACEAVKKAAPFQPRPKSMEGKDIAMEVNIGFRLD